MIAPSAFVHPLAVIGDPPEHREFNADPTMQTYEPEIGPLARINSFVTVDAGIRGPTRIGARTFCMTKTHVGHDAQIGEDCELAPGTVIGGHAILGNGVKCGVGVLVRPFVKIGDGARLGAGAVVVKDVPAGEVWVGNPAKMLPKKQDDFTPADRETWEEWFRSRPKGSFRWAAGL